MAEEEQEVKQEEAPPAEDPAPEKKEPREDDLVGKATAVAERLEKANAQLKRLLERQAKAAAEEVLGGKGEAVTVKRMTKDEKEIAAARAMLEGTGYGEDLFPTEAK